MLCKHLVYLSRPTLGALAAISMCTLAAAAPPPYVRQPASDAERLPAVERAVREEEADEAAVVELVQERFANGKVRNIRYITQDSDRNYVNHGPFVEYSPSGKKIAAGNFAMGQYEGTWTRWHDSSQSSLLVTTADRRFQRPFTSEVQMQDGKLHGTWTIYDAKRLKASVWNFAQGKREGKSTWFYPNGQRAREVDYHEGLIDGKVLAWSGYNKVTEDLTYIKGRRLAKTTYWHSPGVKAAEGETLFAMEPVESSYDWWNANVTFANSSDAGADEKVGVWTWWHANGEKACEGRFDADMEQGKWVFWHKNGQKKTEGSYDAGKRIGPWATWREDGSFAGEKILEGSDASPEVTGAGRTFEIPHPHPGGQRRPRRSAANWPIVGN